MIRISSLFALISLLTSKLLRTILSVHILNKNVKIGRADVTLERSLQIEDKEKNEKKVVLERQNRALQDFFRDTGGKITDIRVLRSAMYLSDEIDRAVRGTDLEDQYIGWRQYNRFYAEGTEDLFTNVPTGKSPLVLASPKVPKDTKIEVLSNDKPLPIEYQAIRRSHLKQVGRTLDQIEKKELERLENKEVKQEEKKEFFVPLERIVPKNLRDYKPEISNDLKVSLYQPFEQKSKKSIKERILRFEGEITDQRPDYDYKYENE